MASTTSGSDDSSSTVEVVYNITIRARIQKKIKILINRKKKGVSELQRESISKSKFHDQVTGPEYNTDLVSRSAPAKRPRITSIKTVHKSINTSYCVTCHHSF